MNRRPLRNPTRVIPDSRASCTARLEGADTEAIAGMPAATAFCTISNPPLPLTIKMHSPSGSSVLEECPADYLVHGVVPADVFPQHQQVSRCAEKSRSMQTARPSEDLLLVSQKVWKMAEQISRESEPAIRRRQAAPADGVYGRFSADAAA